jgi:cytochrome d ubiquinol oxidase subunit II
MVLLACLIGRAVSIEFRSKRPSTRWRRYWDLSFFASSALAVGVMGVAVGNTLRGVPIDREGVLRGGLGALLSPYALGVGLLTIATSAMRGAIFLYLKTEGPLRQRVHGWMWRTFGLFLVLYLAVTIATLVTVPHATLSFRRWPAAWLVVALNVLAVANVPRAIHQGRPVYAFVSSCATIAALTFAFGMALYPNLVVSTLGAGSSLTLYNSASSVGTLRRMRTIALLGGPFVLSYTAAIYWIFRGKVKLDRMSY